MYIGRLFPTSPQSTLSCGNTSCELAPPSVYLADPTHVMDIAAKNSL